VRNVDEGTIYLIVDGVVGPKVSDTQKAVIPATANATVLGAQPNGSTAPVAAGVVFSHARFDRKVVAIGDLLTPETPKASLEQIVGYPIGSYPDGVPSSRPSNKFWVGQFVDPLRGMTGDSYDPFGPLYYPLQQGQTVAGLVNLNDGELMTDISRARNTLVDTDATVGSYLMARSTIDGLGTVFTSGSAYDGLDFVQNTSDFTITLTFRIDAPSATQQYLFHNNGGSGANAGFYLIYNPDNKLQFSITNGTTRMVSESTKSFEVGTWYTVVIRGNGSSGNPVTMDWVAWDRPGEIPNNWTSETWAAVTGGDGAWASTQPLLISGRNNLNRNADWSFKDITVDDVALTDEQIEAQMANTLYIPGG
jgi:hypothetical protein